MHEAHHYECRACGGPTLAPGDDFCRYCDDDL